MTEKIDEVLHAAVARGDVPGVVALVAGPDGVLYEGAATGAPPIRSPPTPCCVIAAMTKMDPPGNWPSGACLSWTPRVETYRPEFASLPVLEGFDGAGTIGRKKCGRRNCIAHWAHRRDVGGPGDPGPPRSPSRPAGPAPWRRTSRLTPTHQMRSRCAAGCAACGHMPALRSYAMGELAWLGGSTGIMPAAAASALGDALNAVATAAHAAIRKLALAQT